MAGSSKRKRRTLKVSGDWKPIFVLLGRLCVGALVFLCVILLILRWFNPPVTPLMGVRALQSYWSGTEYTRRWNWISIDSIPKHVQQAVIAAEDARFTRHYGIDFFAMEMAMSSKRSSRTRGASTITMQTVKNVFFWPGRSYIRKGLELGITPFADFLWGKRRTLELYLNIIEWGNGIYGIEAAARYHFKKSARDLTAQESAALAAVLPNPRRFSPKSLSSLSRRRFERILREMRETQTP